MYSDIYKHLKYFCSFPVLHISYIVYICFLLKKLMSLYNAQRASLEEPLLKFIFHKKVNIKKLLRLLRLFSHIQKY
jgi:hypothetical protein